MRRNDYLAYKMPARGLLDQGSIDFPLNHNAKRLPRTKSEGDGSHRSLQRTVIVIGSDITGGSCGMCVQSASTSCSVC